MKSSRIVATTLAIVFGSMVSITPVQAVSPSPGFSPRPGTAVPAPAHLVLGNESCVKCHASEIQAWKQTPHSQTFDELHRRPEAKQIAAKLGIRSIKHEGRCVACHYTQKIEAGTPHVIAGVSCESCHGAAKHWVDLHQEYGGEGDHAID